MDFTEEDLEDPYKSSSKWATKMFDATWPHGSSSKLKAIRIEEVERLLMEDWTMDDYRTLMAWYQVDYSWGMRGNSVRKRTRQRHQEVNEMILAFALSDNRGRFLFNEQGELITEHGWTATGGSRNGRSVWVLRVCAGVPPKQHVAY